MIDKAFITLGQLLKHTDIISSGGMAKWYLAENAVRIDGELENRRGKKIYPGSVVEVPDEGTFIIKQQKEKTDAASDETV
ncbi:S4 domain protein YaaA [Pisciglobus halotolerans]|uniref:S4 domain protein YaaA n=2 Tax=Pisciglobus halotolerans TaxID=745365 RepID=A0A1I3D4X3_9LACT|nr:S4 domain protein YaaA [Pisciglobus halotolerans]